MSLPTRRPPKGVRIVGSGSALPARSLSNQDLMKVMETSDDWIRQRTGITSRQVYSPDNGETTASLATTAVNNALADAGMKSDELDLIVAATMTPDMPTPSVACQTAAALGCHEIGAFDINAACSGFVFSLNMVHEYIRGGRARNVALVGVDTITQFIDYSTYGRGAAILFGDAASAMILKADENPDIGMIAESMHSDGHGGKHLFIPEDKSHFDKPDDYDERKINCVQMNGQAVFRFAVSKFPALIEATLKDADLTTEDVQHYICHQANARILESARDRFGLPEHKLPINIDRYGNTVAASCPLVFDEERRAGNIKDGERIMFLAFGAGLTWGSSLWQL